MDQRVAFIADWLRDEWTMTRAGGRGTALVARRRTNGSIATRQIRRTGWPIARGRRKQHGRAMADAVRDAVLALRRAHPRWGPKKLRADLAGARPASGVAGGEHDGRSVAPRGAESAAATPALCRAVDAALGGGAAPNDVWTADFKGWFRTADGTRCDPLTIADACSRFVLCCRIVAADGRRRAAVVRADVSRRTGCRGRCGPTMARRLRRRGRGSCRIWRSGGSSWGSSSIGLIRGIRSRMAATSGFI